MVEYKLTAADVADLIQVKIRRLGMMAENKPLIVPDVGTVAEELSSLVEYATVVFLSDKQDECQIMAPNQENGTE